MTKTLEAQLTSFSLESKDAAFVVILPEVPAQGGEAYAAILGKSWDAAPFWGVFLHVPGDEGGSWIALGATTELLSFNELSHTAKRISSYAQRENEAMEKIKTGTEQLLSEMKFTRLQEKRINERKAMAYREGVSQYFSNHLKSRSLMLLFGVGLLFLLMGIVFMIYKIKRRRFTFVFPATEHRRRLQGPWSGGGNVLYSYAISSRKTASKK